MRYFKRLWSEPRGDAHSDWGCSWWYFEVDDNGRVVRQIEEYDNGTVLKYGPANQQDQYGKLADEFDPRKMAGYEIAKIEFQRRWTT